MDKKILVSMMVIGLVATLAGAGMYAYFNDTETSKGNILTAGTLDLKVDGKDNPDIAHIVVDNIYPGWSDTYTWTLKNEGSIAGKLSIEFSTIISKENGLMEPEISMGDTETKGELDTSLCCRINSPGSGSLAYLNTWSGKTVIKDISLGPGAEVVFSMDLYLLESVGNIIQSDSVEFDIIFHLVQA